MSSWTCSVCHQVNPMSTYRCRSCNHGNIVRTHNANSRRKEDQRKGIYQPPIVSVPDTVADMLKLMHEQAKEKQEEKWICLCCKSSRKGHHGTLDDGITPCPNKGKE